MLSTKGTKRNWLNVRRESFAQSLEKWVTVGAIISVLLTGIVFLILLSRR